MIVLPTLVIINGYGLLSEQSTYNTTTEEIGPETLLFEGSNYSHRLSIMDFLSTTKPHVANGLSLSLSLSLIFCLGDNERKKKKKKLDYFDWKWYCGFTSKFHFD